MDSMEVAMAARRAVLTPEYLAEDRSYQLVGISIAFAVLTTVILSLRFYAKRFQGGGIYADDMFLCAAYVVNLGMCAVGISKWPVFADAIRPAGQVPRDVCEEKRQSCSY